MLRLPGFIEQRANWRTEWYRAWRRDDGAHVRSRWFFCLSWQWNMKGAWHHWLNQRQTIWWGEKMKGAIRLLFQWMMFHLNDFSKSPSGSFLRLFLWNDLKVSCIMEWITKWRKSFFSCLCRCQMQHEIFSGHTGNSVQPSLFFLSVHAGNKQCLSQTPKWRPVKGKKILLHTGRCHFT